MESFLCANYLLSCLQFCASLLFLEWWGFAQLSVAVFEIEHGKIQNFRIGTNLHQVSDDCYVCSLEYFAHMFQLCIHNIC